MLRNAALRLTSFLYITATSPPIVGALVGESRGKSDVRSRSGDLSIPDWKLEQVLHPGSASAADGYPDSGNVVHHFAVGSTQGQDTGRCPMLKLPQTLSMRVAEATWCTQSGAWQATNGVSLLSYSQNFFSQSWDSVYIRNLDGRMAATAVVATDDALMRLYGWMRLKSPMQYEAIAKLENQWWNALNKFHNASESASDKYSLTEDHEQRWKTIALVDCDGRLLFVLQLLVPPWYMDDRVPHGIEVYDRNGGLIAHSMVDPTIARHQFVDPRGYRIATAESPGLYSNISLKDLVPDPDRGNVLPYELHFEDGGYQNASRLLDVDYRWVLAAAIQLRAIQDAHSGWVPVAPKLLTAAYCVLAVLVVAFMFFSCAVIYRVVYPPQTEGVDMWDRKTQMFPAYPQKLV